MDNELEIVGNPTNNGLKATEEVTKNVAKKSQILNYAGGIMLGTILGVGLCLLVEKGVNLYNSKKAEKTSKDESNKPEKS